MEYILKDPKMQHDFAKAVQGNKVPVLTLDQKWHKLFPGNEKPKEIREQEKKLNDCLAAQGKAQQELKELKKLKATLMNNIVQNMDGTEGNNQMQEKKLAEDRRLIDEANEKMEACEDTLLDIPRRIKEANDLLLQLTIEYCYYKLRSNQVDIEEIGSWITNMRIELKRQIIRKQIAEINNREIYAYMHDIFGPSMVDIFDLKYQEEEDGDHHEQQTDETV